MIELSKIEKVYQIIVGELISIDKNQCAKTLYFDSACNKCQSACHVSAISLENGIDVDFSKCDGCGFCEQACPNSVFEFNKPSVSDLLSQIKIIRKTSDVVIFKCKPNLKRKLKPAEIALDCFGRINEGILVATAYYGFKEIFLEAEHCLECQKYRPEIMEQTVKLAQDIVYGIGLNCEINLCLGNLPGRVTQNENTLNDSDKSDASIILSRKEFFKHLKAQAINNAGKAITENILDFEDNGGRPEKKLPIKRNMVLSVVRQTDNGLKRFEGKGKNYFFDANIEKSCTGCDFCSNYCPTKAIERIVENDHVKILFSTSLCTGCNLCAEVCPEQCLKIKPKENFTGFAEKNALVELIIQRCTDCGMEFTSKQILNKCPHCKKIAALFNR